MRVLVACEQSQEVTEAFINKGHDAMSCDKYYPGAKGLPHFKGDLMEIINDNWDLIVAFPPCTYISNVQNIHYNERKWPERTERRKVKREKAITFFNKIRDNKCSKISIENPFPSPYALFKIGKYNQMVHPYLFGDPFRKKICLWLKGLPLLTPTNIVDKGEVNKGKAGRTNAKWYHNMIRSKTFPGIAKAMAEQWG